MAEEIKKLIYYLKRTLGKWEFTESELLNVLSMRTRFLTPVEVKEFLNIAVQHKYLKLENDTYSITTSLVDVSLPVDYRPDFKTLVEEKGERDLFVEILEYIVQSGKMTKKEVLVEVSRIREMNPIISSYVACLLVAKLNGLDVQKFTDELA